MQVRWWVPYMATTITHPCMLTCFARSHPALHQQDSIVGWRSRTTPSHMLSADAVLDLYDATCTLRYMSQRGSTVAGGETPPPSLHASVARRDGGRSPANATPIITVTIHQWVSIMQQ